MVEYFISLEEISFFFTNSIVLRDNHGQNKILDKDNMEQVPNNPTADCINLQNIHTAKATKHYHIAP